MKDTFLKPNIQLFAEGDADLDNGGNNANQNGGNGSEQKTYTQEELDRIVNERTGRATKSALTSFFKQKGLTEDGYTRPSILYKDAIYNTETGKTTGTVINDYYVRLCADGIGTGLNVGDYIKISGMTANDDSLYDVTTMGFSKSDIDDTSCLDNLNNHYFRLYDVGENYIVIKVNLEVSVPYVGSMTISKLMPESDFDCALPEKTDKKRTRKTE